MQACSDPDFDGPIARSIHTEPGYCATHDFGKLSEFLCRYSRILRRRSGGFGEEADALHFAANSLACRRLFSERRRNIRTGLGNGLRSAADITDHLLGALH